MTEPTSAERRRRARSFGADAVAYAEHRPDYPADAVRWGLPAQASAVLDLAAGTGKLTEGLLALGLEVTAVEPDPEMRAEFVRGFPRVPAFDGTAERIPLPGASVDSVLVGQAMHWFDLEPALTEIARVLRPGGTLVALWNFDDESVPWVAKFRELAKTGVSRDWLSQTGLPEHPDYTGFERRVFSHTQRRTAETLVATVATHSHILVAPAEEREKALADVRDFLHRAPETANGEFELPIVTPTLRAVRR